MTGLSPEHPSRTAQWGRVREHASASASRICRAGLLALILAGAGTFIPSGAHATPPLAADTVCTGPRSEMAAINQEILAHNAKPHTFTVPQEQAAADAYNAEAAALNSRADAIQLRLDSCLVAATKLSNWPTGPGIPAAMPSKLPQLIKSARINAPSQQEAAEKLLEVLDDAAQEYDDEWANQVLQDEKQPAPGDPDPAFPGGTIGTDASGPQVTPGYVIPLSDILEMGKFMSLTPENMWMVTMSPVNRQWISDQAALAKNSPSVAAVSGLDDAWVQQQSELADSVRQKLLDAIEMLLKSQEEEEK